MWIPKWKRDKLKGVDSPMPTQVVSNEEFIPRPQTKKQKQVEALIGEMAEEKSKKLGMDRRVFMGSSMGLATCFLASNKVYGNYWNVDEAETLEKAAYEEKWPKGEYFIIDVQTHFADLPKAIGDMGLMPFRNMEWVKNMGFNLKNDADAYSFRNFVKEIFFDSETAMCVISGVPTREVNKDPKTGKVLEGKERVKGERLAILPSFLMAESRDKINDIAGGERALSQGNCAPNHYWNKAKNEPDWNLVFEQMDREVNKYKIKSWKWYCHFDPGRSGGGFRLDDEKVTYPLYEQSRKLGLKTFSVHKGFAAQSRTLGHMAHPGDVEKAALDNPDLTFIVYHSALKHGPSEPEFDKGTLFNPETGDLAWHADLMKIKERHPEIQNVYCEIGSSFGTLAILHPEMCMHFMGRNIKNYGADHVVWGTDCLWWGAPQWVIDAFKRFDISDELCEKFGYKKITKEDKAKIFGLNAAKIYGVDAAEKRKNLPKDGLEKAKLSYLNGGGLPDNAAFGWVRADV